MSNNTWSAPLKRARERQKISLSQAAQQLNLPEQALITLEREALRAEDLTPYLRGYLKNYCRLLGLPPPLWHQEPVAQPHNKKNHFLKPAQRRVLPWQSLLLVLAVLAALVLLGAILQHQWSTHEANQTMQHTTPRSHR